MEQENKNRITELETKVKKLEGLFDMLKIPGNIPNEIVEAFVQRGFLIWDGDLTFEAGVGGNTFNNIFIRYLNKRYLNGLPSPLVRYTANALTNVCSATGHGFTDGSNITFYSTGTLPGGLDNIAASYFVFNATEDTFQVTTDGINPVDITSIGDGVQYAQTF